MSPSDAIRVAIREQRYVALTYDLYSRVTEPHALILDRNGLEVLRAYQVSGGDALGMPTGWKSFLVADIRGLRMLEHHFSPRQLPAEAGFARPMRRHEPPQAA